MNEVSKYLGQEVIWKDTHDQGVGPGTVLDVTRSAGHIVLRTLEHATQLYSYLWVGIDGVEVIEFPDEEYLALPEIFHNEVRIALEFGHECTACGAPRLYGSSECAEHSMGVDEDMWPDFHDEDSDYMDRYM